MVIDSDLPSSALAYPRLVSPPSISLTSADSESGGAHLLALAPRRLLEQMDQVGRSQFAQRNERLGPRVDGLVEHLLGEPTPVSGGQSPRLCLVGETHSGIAGATIVSAGDDASRCRACVLLVLVTSTAVALWSSKLRTQGGRNSERTDRQEESRALPFLFALSQGGRDRDVAGAGCGGWPFWFPLECASRSGDVEADARRCWFPCQLQSSRPTWLRGWVNSPAHCKRTVWEILNREAWRCQDLDSPLDGYELLTRSVFRQLSLSNCQFIRHYNVH